MLSNNSHSLLQSLQLHLVQLPLLQSFVELGLHDDFALLVGAIGHDLEVDIALKGIHLSITSHDLEVCAQYIATLLIFLNKGDGLVVDN